PRRRPHFTHADPCADPGAREALVRTKVRFGGGRGVKTAKRRREVLMTPALLATRPEGERDPLVARLRALRYRVHAAPTAVTEALPFAPPTLASFDWVVVTSAAGAQALLDAVEAGADVRWAAVGPRTAAELAGRGVVAAAVPEQSRGVRIAEAIAGVE